VLPGDLDCHDVFDVPVQYVAVQHSQPANMFFLNATDSQKGKANPNPRASNAARNSRSAAQRKLRSATQTAQQNAGVKPHA
jgi:hypothetical protein